MQVDCGNNCFSYLRISSQLPCCTEDLAMARASSRQIRQKGTWSGPCLVDIARLVSGGDPGKARSVRPSKLTSSGQDGLSGSTANAGARIGQKVRVGNMFQSGHNRRELFLGGSLLRYGLVASFITWGCRPDSCRNRWQCGTGRTSGNRRGPADH